VAPRPGGSFTFAEARYDSVCGMIGSRWEKRDGKTLYTITVPVNCTAEVRLPGGLTETVGPGEHRFTEE
jgi:alpha-L-rhamnosidase